MMNPAFAYTPASRTPIIVSNGGVTRKTKSSKMAGRRRLKVEG